MGGVEESFRLRCRGIWGQFPTVYDLTGVFSHSIQCYTINILKIVGFYFLYGKMYVKRAFAAILLEITHVVAKNFFSLFYFQDLRMEENFV